MLKNALDHYVISSRVRLARNFDGYRFVPTVSVADARVLLDKVSPVLAGLGLAVRGLSGMRLVELDALKERNLISASLIANADIAAVAISPGLDAAVMIHEEDHLRIQSILPGLEMTRAYEYANRLDSAVGKRLPYAYDTRLGYLTSCPSNLGTGMRASVMMFLPGLNLSGQVAKLSGAETSSGITFRGVFGEGSNADGFLYQLSNRHTLGLSEREILSEVGEWVDRIAEKEEQAREQLFLENNITLTDRILRAWGILNNSYIISYREAAEHLGFVKLGLSLGLLNLREPGLLDRLTVECRPAVLAESANAAHPDFDLLRAELLRKELADMRL